MATMDQRGPYHLRDNEIIAISGHLIPEMLTQYTHLGADRLGYRLVA